MFSKEQVEKFITENADKIKQARSLLELVKKIEFKVLNFELTIYTVGSMIRADLKINEEINPDEKR